MGGDIVADRLHAARIVAHALQGKAERRPREIQDRGVAQRRKKQDQIIERDRALQLTPRKCGAGMVVNPLSR